MNTDIRVEVSFKGHRKRKRLRLILGLGSTDYLLDLWMSAAVNRPRGILSGWDALDIALEAGWEGEPEVFVDALIEAGFLDLDDNGVYILHDWAEHQPWCCDAPERSEQARHAANERWRKQREYQRHGCPEYAPNIPDDSPSMPAACSEYAERNAPLLSFPFLSSPLPSPPVLVPLPLADCLEIWKKCTAQEVTPHEAERIAVAVEDYSGKLVAEAILEAASCGKDKVNWRYVETILQRWKNEGRKNGKKGRKAKNHSPPPKDYFGGKYSHLVQS